MPTAFHPSSLVSKMRSGPFASLSARAAAGVPRLVLSRIPIATAKDGLGRRRSEVMSAFLRLLHDETRKVSLVAPFGEHVVKSQRATGVHGLEESLSLVRSLAVVVARRA